MSEPKPFASLSPSLLARKGSAKPAMRPQLQPLPFGEDSPFGSQLRQPEFENEPEPAHLTQDDLGWNDMGEEVLSDQQASSELAAVSKVVPINGTESAASPVAAATSPALRQLQDLAETIAAAPASRAPRLVRSALKEGRKAAFTLRVDGERHLRLRLACTLQNRSAQQVVTEALDRLLEDLPGLDELSRRVKRH